MDSGVAASNHPPTLERKRPRLLPPSDNDDVPWEPVVVTEPGTARRTEWVSRTELSRLLEHDAGQDLFRVSFHKKPDAHRVADMLETYLRAHRTYDASAAARAERELLCKQMLAGEERVLVGHLEADPATGSTAPVLGRFRVREVQSDGVRLVDTRTIDALLLRGVKYIASDVKPAAVPSLGTLPLEDHGGT